MAEGALISIAIVLGLIALGGIFVAAEIALISLRDSQVKQISGKGKRGARNKALKLVEEGRTNLATTADYTDGSAIDRAIKAMIDKVIADRTIAEANG